MFKTLLAIQNYSDFRYIRRYNRCDANLHWMLGSGGVERLLASGVRPSSIAVVSRESKIKLQIESIDDFLSDASYFDELFIVGVMNLRETKTFTNSVAITTVGYVEQSAVLSYSSNIFIPDGYGEGLPHVFVDALVSGRTIYLSKFSAIKFGLYNFKNNFGYIGTGRWVRISSNQIDAEPFSALSVNRTLIYEASRFLDA